MGIVDSKLTPYDVKNIVLLNNIMSNNEYFRAINGTDTGCINHMNIHSCTRILELHTFLIKHYKLIPRLFNDDMHSNWNRLQHIINLIDENNAPISSVLKSLGIEE